MKKSISIVLAILMCFSCFSIISFAETTDSEHITTIPEGYVGVYDIEDLYCIRNDMSANYILMNDIDLTEATAEGGDWNYGGRGWNPIGSNDVYGGTEFEGIFDGNNYSIIGLNIDINSYPSGKSLNTYIGLFSIVSGTIKNLCVNGTLSTLKTPKYNHYSTDPNYYFGGICAYLSEGGTIENCTNNVNISIYSPHGTSGASPNLHYYVVRNYIGGIAGYSEGIIKYCSNYGNIDLIVKSARDSSSNCCGIAFSTSNDISYCLNSGDICITSNGTETTDSHYSCNATAYGIGYKANNCYNKGNIDGSASGNNSYFSCYGIGRFIENCYNIGFVNGKISTNPTKCYYLENSASDPTGATPLTDTQMKLQSMYSGWDFDTIWTMEGREDYPYPELRDVPLVLPDDKKTEITAEISIVGNGKVGSVLSADIKNLTPENATYSYEWTVGNTVVSTEETYTVAQSDVNKDIILTIKGNGDFKGKISSETVTGICVHNAEEFTYNNDATCTKNGTNTATCLLCGEEFTVEAENTIVSHTFENYVYQNDATCTNDGTSVAKCEYCDATDSKTADGTKTGHSFSEAWIIDKEATCSEEGIKSHHCKNCDAKADESALKKLAHEHSATVTNATCSENGKIVYTCICGDTYTEIIYASGHIDNDGDSNCDSCYEPIETDDNEPECKCICHETGIVSILYKILVTVQRYFKVDLIGKVFKMGKLCECGEYHY